ncbi:sulfotransferase [Mycolicibacterium sp. BiH015]|uniref:sulfotransferase family protein n=1 Tax=Mycolicibacterium sp. BiH015 TaxID=3018808 RepID=UPI0022E4F8A7|nr:sulfotransferase [Mycolicibacterium sp. BiH015]MDA2892498.1 sulfotransferase [Mycolicibacterium sp. BiH015]
MDQPGPLLVLAAGQRCGSTLIQRLLCSHPQVRIWGEHAGQLRPLPAVGQRLARWSESSGMAGRQELDRHGHQGFIANLMPERSAVDAACIAFVESLFAAPARAQGRPIWGFKEVHYRLSDVLTLRRLLPGVRVITLVRDPRHVLRSLDEWERHGGWTRTRTEQALRLWAEVASSFLPAADDPGLREFVLPIRYEDLVSFSHGWTEAIAGHCRLDPSQLDEAVFAEKVHTAGPRGRATRALREWSALPTSLRALVDDEIVTVASAYGYDL